MANEVCSKCGQPLEPQPKLRCGWAHAAEADTHKILESGCLGRAVSTVEIERT